MTAQREPIPDWLVTRLVAGGFIDGDTGATQRARYRRCRVCALAVIRGFDADWGYMSVDLDPRPLTALGEAMALVGGLRTFHVRSVGGWPTLMIVRRDRFNRAANAAGAPGTRVDVHHEHVHPPVPALPRMASVLPGPPAAVTSEEPPY